MKIIKKKYILLVLFILTVLSVIYIYSLVKIDKSVPTQQTSPLPTMLVPFVQVNKLLGGSREIPFDNFAIEFSFSKEVDPQTIDIKIAPYIDFGVNYSKDKKTVFIYPSQRWEYKTKYSLELNVQSMTGDTLSNSIFYEFIPEKPINSTLDERKI